ncbi:MAG: thermonuclease family protein [bacterium]|nr:thermonuclease family protein [bacterium]
MILRLIGAALLATVGFVLWAAMTAKDGDALFQESSRDAKTSEVAGVDETAFVTRVLDGDTIVLANGEKVRYIGIDAPELYGSEDAAECFAAEALAKNRDLVLNKEVRLEKDTSDTDKYGRLLRYVYLGDEFVNVQLVSEGFAYAASYYPDTAKDKALAEAERDAQENGRGLWEAGTCE